MREAVKKRDAKPENKEKSLSKRRATMLEKYGVEYNSQREEVKPSLAKNKISVENRSRVNSRDWMFEQYVTLGKTHEVIAREFNLDKSSITNALRFHEIEASGPTANAATLGEDAGEAIRTKAGADFFESWG